jgi:hypothetical protein
MRNGGSPDRVNSAMRVRHRLGLNRALKWYIGVDSGSFAQMLPHYNTVKDRITAKNQRRVEACDRLTRQRNDRSAPEESWDSPF